MEQNLSTPQRDFLLLAKPEGRPMHVIAMEICHKYGLTIADLRSRRQTRSLSTPRQEFWFRCVRETPASLPEMAAYLNREYSTARDGLKQYERRMKETNGPA